MAETVNYEEDKVSPEKEDEKPVYESTEGPIPKQRKKWGGNNRGGKSNVLMSGESFGMNPLRSVKGNIGESGKNRQVISDNFLEEDEENEAIRSSAESGEIDPAKYIPRR